VLVAASLLGEVCAQVDLDVLAPDAPQVQQTADKVDKAVDPGDSKCSCDCCQVSARRETQQVNGAKEVCSTGADPNAPGTCPNTCLVDAENSAITNDGDGQIDTSRYCMMNCLPADNAIGGKCRSLTDEEQAQLVTEGGNGQDPAAVLVPTTTAAPDVLKDPEAPPEPPQLVDQQAEAAAGSAAAEGGKDAGAAAAAAAAAAANKKKAKETGAMVAMAAGKQAKAAGIEARIAKAEAVSATGRASATSDLDASNNNALMVNAARAQVQAAEVRAKVYADSAKKAAARAQAELKEIQAIPAKAAALAAEEAKKFCCEEMQEMANNLAIVKSRLAGPGLPVPLAEASVRAAQPYYNIMQKAIANGNLYEASARQLQDQAQGLQEQSRTVASQAVAYQQAGYGELAQQLMAQAKGMLSTAQAKDAQAQKDFAVAEGVRKQVPNYQANAAAASARATAIANPGGQPPPAVAPPSLIERTPRLRKSLRVPS
jgi:hypothetical protein